MIRNTGMVNAGFSRYLIEGFNIGIPPTEAMLMKKNKILTSIRQNPIEYISFLLNSIAILPSFFRKNLGSTAHPIKKATNPMANVTARLLLTEFKDSNRNTENKKITISGLKI